MNKKNQKGFTLVELIVVIAIVAILASVAIVGYTQFIKNARDSKAQAELDQVYNVLYADVVATPYEVVGGLKVEVAQGKLKLTGATEENVKTWLERYNGNEAALFIGTLTFEANTLTFVPSAGGSGERDIVFDSDSKIEIKFPAT